MAFINVTINQNVKYEKIRAHQDEEFLQGDFYKIDEGFEDDEVEHIKEDIEISKIDKAQRLLDLQLEHNKLKAINGYLDFLGDYPEDKIGVYTKLGIIYYYDLKNVNAAKVYFDILLKEEPFNPYALFMQAKINEDLKLLNQADEYYKNAAIANPSYILELAKFHIRQGEYNNALEVLKNCDTILNAGYFGEAYNANLFLSSIAYLLVGKDSEAVKALQCSNIDISDALCELNQMFSDDSESIEHTIKTFIITKSELNKNCSRDDSEEFV